MGANIDPARRFIEDQELRFGQQPTRKQHLLLIAAGEKFDRLFGAGGTNTELADKAIGNVILLASRNRPQPATLGLQCQDDIFPHRCRGDNPVGFTILRTEADAQA